MRVVYSLLILIVTVSLFQACKKKVQTAPPIEEEQGTATIQLKNTIKDSVYLFLNGHDITTGVIPHIIKMTLAPESEVTIPRAELKDGFIYDYSWNTADYTYSNWWKLDTNNKPVIEQLIYYSKSETNYNIDIAGSPRNDLLICLDGDGLSSEWQAIDAFDASGTSVWSTLSDSGKNQSFTLRRSHVVKHKFIDTAGKAVSTNLAYLMDITAPRTWLRVEQYIDNYVLTNDLTGVVALQTSAKDQLYYAAATFDTTGITVFNGPYYLLSRTSVER